MDEKEKKAWREQHEKELEERRKVRMMRPTTMQQFHERWKGAWFLTDQGQREGGYPVPYQEIVRNMLKNGANKRTIDDSIDALVAAGRLIPLTPEELQDRVDKDFAKLVEETIAESGNAGITEDELFTRVSQKLDRRAYDFSSMQKETKKPEMSLPRTEMFMKSMAEGGGEAAAKVYERYPMRCRKCDKPVRNPDTDDPFLCEACR